MAVTISDSELAAGMMLTGSTGGVLDTPVEPILGRIQRFLAVATAIINMRIPEAPNDVQNECAVKLSTYWFNQPPAARMSGFANAWANSGCGTVAAGWTQRPVSGGALTLHVRGRSPWLGVKTA